MKKLFKIAVVGRPNVGKSSLFNRICQRRIAIVDEAEGITRDRLYADGEVFGKQFTLIDTGGIDAKSKVPFNEEIRRQAEIAIEEADSLILVVDAMIGITSLDREVAKMILRRGKDVTLAVNKVDSEHQEANVHEFYSLGISKMVNVSAQHGHQIAELLEQATEHYTDPVEEDEDDGSIKVAIVGRPNVGKSTLVNQIFGEERCVVSPIAGTTRDSVDVHIERDGKRYTLIDTAGVRRKKSEHEVVDKFAAIRTQRAIARADICVLMVDSREVMTTQEKRIATEIEEAGKGCVIVLNKWDLMKNTRMEHVLKDLREAVHFLQHCPSICTSAITGRNMDKLFDSIGRVYAAYTGRITTGQLNGFIEKTIQKYHPPMLRGKRLRIYYIAQVSVAPPRFVAFVNNPAFMARSYQKYLVNQFRETYGLPGIPLQFTLRGRGERKPGSVDDRLEAIGETKRDQLDEVFSEL